MAKITKDDIISSLKEMTLLEINDLIKSIENEFNVKADAISMSQASNQNNKEEEASKASEVSLLLKSVGTQKVAVIKAIQSITGLGLMDSKKIVDSVPSVVKEKISSTEAEEYKKTLVSAGAEVEIK